MHTCLPRLNLIRADKTAILHNNICILPFYSKTVPKSFVYQLLATVKLPSKNVLVFGAALSALLQPIQKRYGNVNPCTWNIYCHCYCYCYCFCYRHCYRLLLLTMLFCSVPDYVTANDYGCNYRHCH